MSVSLSPPLFKAIACGPFDNLFFPAPLEGLRGNEGGGGSPSMLTEYMRILCVFNNIYIYRSYSPSFYDLRLDLACRPAVFGGLGEAFLGPNNVYS